MEEKVSEERNRGFIKTDFYEHKNDCKCLIEYKLRSAVMAYKTIPGTRRAQKTVHWLLHLIALLAGIIGIYAAFKFHHESGIPNMYTLHSWLGMITICLYGLQVIEFMNIIKR